MQIKNKNDLIAFVNAVISNKKINDTSSLKKIREKTEEIILSKGDIFPNYFLELFENFQDTVITQDEKITNHINFFNKYYSNATNEEKFIINNLIFGLEILNGNAKNGLKDFIKRTFEFNLQANAGNEYVLYAVNFIMNVKTKDSLLIETVKEIINPEYFLNKDTYTKRAYFVNFLSILWNNPIMMNNKIWLNIFNDLVELLQKCRESNLFEEHMYIQFFTYHIYGNNIQTINEWRKFNELIEKPASKFYNKYALLNNLSKPKKKVSAKKKKIGFVIDRIAFNSPYMVMYSLWEYLMKNKEFTKNYEIYVYSLNYLDKQSENQNLIYDLENLGLNVYSPQNKFINYKFYYPHIQKAIDIRNKIIEDKIDYLITTVSGYDINNFLITNRSAPKQIYWSHGNCIFDIPNIDKRISHFEQECKEFKWEIFNVPVSKKFLVGSKKEKEQGLLIKKELLKEFGKNTVFLGTIGRLVKIESEEYLKLISVIMKQNPNTVYLACGSGNQKKIEELMQKQGIDLKRVIFTGQVNPHIFGWVIDVWSDSFPLGQGQSKDEFIAKGGAVVFHRKRGDMGKSQIFLAETDEEYIDIANKLIKDKSFRKKINEIQKFLWFTKDKENKNSFREIIK